MTEEVKKYKPTNEELEKHNNLIKESQNEAMKTFDFLTQTIETNDKSSIVENLIKVLELIKTSKNN